MNRKFPLSRHLWRLGLLPIACLLLSATPRVATADELDDVLKVMEKYGGLDPAIRDAREMLDCLVSHNGDATACFDIPTEAEKQAGKAAAKYMPDDPKIQAIVDIVFAVQKNQWLTVIELAGLDIMAPLICENAARASGPVGKWFCAKPFRQVVDSYAEPIVEEAFRLINGGGLDLGKLFELVALLADLDLACQLIPKEIPGVGDACSVFGKIVAEIGGLFVDAAKYGAVIVVETADEVENIIFGSDAHIPYDKYYGLYWLPWLHRSVNLCITNNCKGTGELNASIWNACVDYFDTHNQYRDTAKKTCSDLRDKRYIKAYELLAIALVEGARSYVGTVRNGARAWAITEYGKNNNSAIRSQFLTLCESELEQGYPLSSGDPAMCDAYKIEGSSITALILDGYYQKCTAQVAAQQVSPTAWRNACKKAEPDFIVMLQGEQQALQNELTALVSEGCVPVQGWNAQQGLRLQCQTYSGYDHCKDVMVVGANSICGIDRAKADAARAKEILAFLGTVRCSLSGSEILCHRPWKHAQCQKLVTGTPSIQLSKTGLACKEESVEYYKIAFANQELLNTLNHPIARSGQGPSCTWMEDKAKIRCLRVDILESLLTAKPELQRPLCKPDPHYNGSDVSCYLKPYNSKTAPQLAAADIASTPATVVQRRDGAVGRDTPMQPGAVSPAATASSPNQSVALPEAAAPEVAPVRTAAPGIRALNTRTGGLQAASNACRYEATYYEPLPPTIETSSPAFKVGDQVQIRCAFQKRTRMLEWQQCDDFAKNAIEVMKLGVASGSRYSGLFVVDSATIGVSTSPIEGGDFDDAATWTFQEAGIHVVSCMIDNGLRPAEKDGAVYLESQSEFSVGGASGPESFRRFDPDTARRLPTRETPSELIRREPPP